MPIDKLPTRYQPVAYRLRSWMQTDGVIMLWLALVSIPRPLSFMAAGDRSVIEHPVEEWMPDAVWITIWLVVSALLLVCSVRHDGRLASVALALGVGLHVLLAASYFSVLVFPGWPTELWVAGVMPIGVAVAVPISVWRGTRPRAMEGKNAT